MSLTMPAPFPTEEFRAFGLATGPFFPKISSAEDSNDTLRRRLNFDWAWQAVRYRYRGASEANEEFQTLLAEPPELWAAGWGDEEFAYKLERCIYTFFVSGLSVFDSFAYGLYFLGHSVAPASFPDVGKPRKITRATAAAAFNGAFPAEQITAVLTALSNDIRFKTTDAVRNVLAHRLSGRHGSYTSLTRKGDGSFTTDFHEETWDIPDIANKLIFDKEMLQRQLDDITAVLTPLITAAREFAEARKSTAAYA
jgi:hypothetical protein